MESGGVSGFLLTGRVGREFSKELPPALCWGGEVGSGEISTRPLLGRRDGIQKRFRLPSAETNRKGSFEKMSGWALVRGLKNGFFSSTAKNSSNAGLFFLYGVPDFSIKRRKKALKKALACPDSARRFR